MHPAIITAVRATIEDWRREAQGSGRSAEQYERIALEHRVDEAPALKQVADLEAALRAEGVATPGTLAVREQSEDVAP